MNSERGDALQLLERRPVPRPKKALTGRGWLLRCERFLLDEAVPRSFKSQFDAALGLLTLWLEAKPVHFPEAFGKERPM
jgi:hypothetical protein